MTHLDPITIEIVTSRLAEVTASMEQALYHAGYSPILRESRDGTAGLTDADGRVLMVGGGLQFHSLPYQQAIAGVTARFPRETMRPGDSFLVNDPYTAGNPHVPDFVTVTPSFFERRLIGFGVSIAHKADVGGLVPGSSGAGSREIFHDGLRLPPVIYSRGGVVNEAVEDIIRTNSRIPDVVIGDLRGQSVEVCAFGQRGLGGSEADGSGGGLLAADDLLSWRGHGGDDTEVAGASSRNQAGRVTNTSAGPCTRSPPRALWR